MTSKWDGSGLGSLSGWITARCISITFSMVGLVFSLSNIWLGSSDEIDCNDFVYSNRGHLDLEAVGNMLHGDHPFSNQ